MKIQYRKDLNLLLPNNPVTCEVGVASALFSELICEYWRPSKHYLIDAWECLPGTGDRNFPQEWHNMNYHIAKWKMYPYQNIATFIRGLSWNMSQHIEDNSLDIVYHDAGHDEQSVQQDIDAYWPKIKPGGIMGFHDFEAPEYQVGTVVRRFALKHGIDVHSIPEDKMEDAGGWIRKPK